MSKDIKEAAKQYAEIETKNVLNVRATAERSFIAGAAFKAKKNPWRNFKKELPKPNSHILRRMANSDYQAYGKVTYYADFWGEDRPDKWEQDNDRVVYEWQYINE